MNRPHTFASITRYALLSLPGQCIDPLASWELDALDLEEETPLFVTLLKSKMI